MPKLAIFWLILSIFLVKSASAQSVQPYVLFRPTLCNGASSASGSFQVQVVNSGGNPANWSSPTFTTAWTLQIQYGGFGGYVTVSSGSFQGQQSTLNFSGITYSSGDDIQMLAVGTGINTASSTSDAVQINQLTTPNKPTVDPTSATICGAGTVNLLANGGAGGNYTWSNGETTNPINVGVGTYTVKETNTCGTSPDSDPVVVSTGSVPTKPTIALPSLPLCNGASGTLTASGSASNTYTWYLNGVVIAGQTAKTTSVTSAGDYTVEETNACGTSLLSDAVTVTTGSTPAAPTVTPAGPLTLCDGASQTLTATGSGISWFLNGAATGSTGATVSVTAAGSYTAKASNSCGVSPASNLVTILTNNTPPAPTLNVSGLILLCDGATLTISTSPSTSGGSIHWSNGATGNSITISTAGTYYAYESNPTCGQGPNSLSVIVSTNIKPIVAAITGSAQVCAGQTITLSDATAGGTWSTSDNSLATINSSGVVTGVSAGTATISYAVTNECGTTTVTKLITINPLPVLAGITGLSGVCIGSTITLANSTSGGSWSSNSTGVATVDGLGIVTGVSAGTAVITYTYTNGNGCTSSTPKTITVWSLPTISISATVNATNAFMTAAGASTYNWSSGEATQSISKAMSTTATYVAEGTDLNGCKNTSSYSVNSSANSGATTISPSNGTTFCNGSTTTLTATFGDSYYWSTGATGQSITVGSSGTYTVFVARNSGSIVEVASINITVSPTTVGGTVSSDATVCSGSNGATLNLSGHTGTILYWEYSTNGGGSWTTIANGTTQQNYLNLTTTTLYRAVIQSGVCPALQSSVATITVNPIPNVNVIGNQVLCNGAASSAINYTGAVGGTLYSWTNDNVTIGVSASGNGNIPVFNAINTGNSPVTANFQVTPTAAGCIGSTRTFTITVNPTPTVAGIANQVLCNGATTNAILYSGTVTGTQFNWTNSDPTIGLAASGINDITSFTAVNAGSSPVTATIVATPVANGCTGVNTSFTIRVNPTPNVAAITNQVLCNGVSTTPVNFTGSVTGTLFSWTNDQSSIGLAASGNGDIASFIATSTGNAPVTATIQVSPTANGCTGLTGSFTIKVSPTPNVASVINQVLCNGSLTNIVTFTGTVLGTLFSWTNTTTSIGLPASGNGNTIPSFTATNSSNTPVIATVTVTAAANGCTTVSTPETKATTGNMAVPVVGANGTTYTVKAGATTLASYTKAAAEVTTTDIATLLVNAINAGTLSHGYAAANMADLISLTAPAGTGSSANGIVATVTWQGAGTLITSSNFSGGVDGTGAVFTIRVNPTPTVSPVSNQVLCNNFLTAPINFSGTVSTTIFSWSNTIPGIGLASNGTVNIASFTATNSSSVPLTANLQVTPSAYGCTGSAEAFTIRVNPTPTVAPVMSQIICNSFATSLVPFTGTVGGTLFSWSNDLSSIGLSTTGTGTIASFTATNGSNAPITANIQVTPSANGCTGLSQSFTVRVNPTPSVNPISSQVLCNSFTTAPVNFTGAVTGTFFNWTNNDATIGLASSGLGNIGSFTTINNGAGIVIAQITVSPVANSCVGPNESFTIRVNPTPIALPVSSQVLCNSFSTTAVVISGSVSGTLFSWSNDLPLIGLASNGTGNIASFTATNSSNAPVTANVQVTPSANGCTGLKQSFTIRVNPTPSVDPISNQVLCNSFNTEAVYFTGYVPGTLYSWTNSDPTIGLSANGTGNISQFAARNLSSIPVISTLRIVPTANGCTGAQGLFTIRVNPTPNVAPVASQVLCNRDTTVQISFTGTVAGTLFSWSNDLSSIGLSTTGTGSIASFTATNGSNAPVTANIQVTPSANGCTGPAENFTLRVNPTPVVFAVASQVICNSDQSPTFIFTGPVFGTNYAWRNTLPAIGVPATGAGNIASFKAINNGSSPVWDTTFVTPSANGCTGITQSFTFRINPTPILSSVLSAASICDSTLFTYTPATLVAGATFAWTRSAVAGITNSASSGTGAIKELLDNNTNDDVTVIYRITTSANDCQYAEDVTVVVHPKPVLKIKSIPDVCDNALFAYNAQSTIVSKITVAYKWTRPLVAGISNPIGIGNSASIAEYLNNTTSAPINVPYYITMTLPGGCFYTDTIMVRVNPTPRLTSKLSTQVCDYSILNYTPISNVSSATFSWSRPLVPGVNNGADTGHTKVAERLLNDSFRIVKAPYYITSTAAGCSGYDTLWATLIPRPFGNVRPSVDTIQSGMALKIKFESKDTIQYRYSWEFGDRLTANTYLNPVEHIYNTRTTQQQTLKVTITNRFGCIDSFAKVVQVIGDPKATPRDTIAVMRNYSMAVFPVPFQTELRLKYTLRGPDEEAMYYVNDLAGKMIYAQRIILPGGDSIITLPSERITKGVVYVIRIKSKTYDYEDKIYRK